MSSGPIPTTPAVVLHAYAPVTFLERGVCVPFTAPMLAGARVRPVERGTLELVIPSPSGGQGAYVLPWASIGELCRPTVHDAKLIEKVPSLRGVTPHVIRAAARETAAEGWAGREAGAAASEADKAETQARLITNFGLLLRLVAQVEPDSKLISPPDFAAPVEIERRIKAALAIVAPKLDRSTDEVAADLETISALLTGVGIGPHAAQARLPRAVEALRATRDELVAWADDGTDDSQLIARMAAAAADFTLACAGPTLQVARAAADDVQMLLARWQSGPDAVAQVAVRPDWLMDGWEPICALWQMAASPSERRAALAEIAPLVPIIPKEAVTWAGLDLDVDGAQRRRTVPFNVDWRTGMTVLDAVRRNEQLRAAVA